MPHSSHDDRELVGGSEGKIFNGDKGGRVGVERMVCVVVTMEECNAGADAGTDRDDGTNDVGADTNRGSMPASTTIPSVLTPHTLTLTTHPFVQSADAKQCEHGLPKIIEVGEDALSLVAVIMLNAHRGIVGCTVEGFEYRTR